MNILSIHDGHNATACFLQDGVVIDLISEERFTNKKNQGGFPSQSVEWILSKNELSWSDIDSVVFPHLVELIEYGNDKNTSGARIIFDYASRLFPRSILSSPWLLNTYFKVRGMPKRRKTLESYARKYGFSPSQIKQVEHHTTHAYSAIYASGFPHEHEKILAFTCDASGDGVSSSVGIWDQENTYSRINETSSFDSLGILYAAVTRVLGMRPNEHEYKLMGMAPYVDIKYAKECFDIFHSYISFDKNTGSFINHKKFGESQLHDLVGDLSMKRFDSICGGIQMHFETLICDWIDYWVKKTGLTAVVCGGGSFMNVKANMLIANNPHIKHIFFCPSSGDESTALGAAYFEAEQLNEKTIGKLENLYLGNEFSDSEIEKCLASYSGVINYTKCEEIEIDIAKLLVDYKIVARFAGRAEWGARALGNRSILCRADNLTTINKLNKSIKMRDFWMPFASSILSEYAETYFHNPKQLSAGFMIVTFDTLPAAHTEIVAGIHPFDYTCRPQTVAKEASPAYWNILTEFRRRTGLSGVLNTSFNLHGSPIVGTPKLAVETLLHSKIDYLAIGNFLVTRTDSTK